MAARRCLRMMAAAKGVEITSPIFNSLKRSFGASPMILSAPLHRLTTHAPHLTGSLYCVERLPLQLRLQQQRRNLAGRACRRNSYRRGDSETHEQEQEQDRKRNNADRQGAEDVSQDAPSVVQRVLDAANNPTTSCGSSFWQSQREEVMRTLKEGNLSLSTAALLVVSFSKAGELTGPLAAAVARRLCTAFRAAARGGASALLLGEGAPSIERNLTAGSGETDFRVHFADGATVLLAMKEAGLLEDPCAGTAARELQEDLLLCVQPQWNSLTFAQLRRLLLLLGATVEPLGLNMAAARELLNAAKRNMRKMQKMTRRVFGEGDACDAVALAWPLACVSAALKIPAPRTGTTSNAVPDLHAYNSSSIDEDMKHLHRDRDIVMQLLKAQIHRAISSRLPCSLFDLALVSCNRFYSSVVAATAAAPAAANSVGFAGLERLGQQGCAEYVLTAFSTTAAAASCEELCRLGRDIMLAGVKQKALWEAFADAVQTAADQQRHTAPSKEHSSAHHRIDAEVARWLRFCGRAR